MICLKWFPSFTDTSFNFTIEFVFKVIAGDSRTKNDIGLYTFVCPESEEIFEDNVC
jgi:hypothetical protein